MSVYLRASSRAAGSAAVRHGRPLSQPRAIRQLSAGIRSHTTTITETPSALLLQSDKEGQVFHRKITSLWLRDNCRCSKCVNQDTMQRNFDTFEIPQEIAPKTIAQNENGLEVKWTDNHVSQYAFPWLEQALYGTSLGQADGKQASPTKFFNARIASNPPEVKYDEVMKANDSAGMANLTRLIHEHGLCFVVDSPKTPEATKAVLESIGPIRNTHYGGFYDFIPDLSLADTAYTNLALAAHTDTTYFTEPAGLQAFHMLSHTPPPSQREGDALGGKSLLVDGFHAAYRLKKESPEHYHTLRNVRIPWHASGNDGIAIAPDRAYPVLEGKHGYMNRVRWNNDDRGVVPTDAGLENWYLAARKWNEILKRPENEYWFQLEPGRILIFDNWRVLHGRSAFEGVRRICGGYIPRDDYISRYKMTNFQRQDVVDDNMQLKCKMDSQKKPHLHKLKQKSDDGESEVK